MIAYRCASMLQFSRLSFPPGLLSPIRSCYSSLNVSFSSAAPSLRIGVYCVGSARRRQTRAFGAASAAAQFRNGAETFFAEESVSWASLGVSDRLARALSTVGIVRPSLVQVALTALFLFILCFSNCFQSYVENRRSVLFFEFCFFQCCWQFQNLTGYIPI